MKKPKIYVRRRIDQKAGVNWCYLKKDTGEMYAAITNCSYVLMEYFLLDQFGTDLSMYRFNESKLIRKKVWEF